MHPINRALLLVLGGISVVALAWMTMTVSTGPEPQADAVKSVPARVRPTPEPRPNVGRSQSPRSSADRSGRTWAPDPRAAPTAPDTPPSTPPPAPQDATLASAAPLQRFQEVAQEIDDMPCPDVHELTTPDLVSWINETQGPIRDNIHTATAELMASPSHRTPGAGAMLQQRVSLKAASCLLDLPIDDDPSTARAVNTFCETARQTDEVVRQLREQGHERGVAYDASHADAMLSRCTDFAADFGID